MGNTMCSADTVPDRRPGNATAGSNIEGLDEQERVAEAMEQEKRESFCYKFWTSYICCPCSGLWCCVFWIFENYFWKTFDRAARCLCFPGKQNKTGSFRDAVDNLFDVLNRRKHFSNKFCTCKIEYIDAVEAELFVAVAELEESEQANQNRGAWFAWAEKQKHAALLNDLKDKLRRELQKDSALTEREFRNLVMDFFGDKMSALINELSSFLDERYHAVRQGKNKAAALRNANRV